MPHREFLDEHGRLWDVWDVHPTAVERRVNADRRNASRASPDRRQRREIRLMVPGELRAGWLAFQTMGERRRVSPIPADWDRLPDDELARLALRATRLRQLPRLIE
jgi:hypothetical protein